MVRFDVDVKLSLELPLAAVCVSERQFWLSPSTNIIKVGKTLYRHEII